MLVCWLQSSPILPSNKPLETSRSPCERQMNTNFVFVTFSTYTMCFTHGLYRRQMKMVFTYFVLVIFSTFLQFGLNRFSTCSQLFSNKNSSILFLTFFYTLNEQSQGLVTFETLVTILTIENLDSWQSLFTWQLIVTLDSIRNSCDVFFFIWSGRIFERLPITVWSELWGAIVSEGAIMGSEEGICTELGLPGHPEVGRAGREEVDGRGVGE